MTLAATASTATCNSNVSSRCACRTKELFGGAVCHTWQCTYCWIFVIVVPSASVRPARGIWPAVNAMSFSWSPAVDQGRRRVNGSGWKPPLTTAYGTSLSSKWLVAERKWPNFVLLEPALNICRMLLAVKCPREIWSHLVYFWFLAPLVFTQHSYCHGAGVRRPFVIRKLRFLGNGCMDPDQILWEA